MGNCQAIDNATLVIQHPNGRADKLYSSVTASEIMKMNPGHYVALLLTTTLCNSNNSATATKPAAENSNTGGGGGTTTKDKKNIPVRITRIKLLRPTDTLVLGHVYRLITAQDVMKGLWAKKYAKKKQQADSSDKLERLTAPEIADLEAAVKKYQMEKTNQIEKNNQGKQERSSSRSRTSPQVNSSAAKSRAWQPKLQSISEAGS